MGTQDNLYSVPTAYWDSPQSLVQSFSLCRPPWRLVRKTSETWLNRPSQWIAGNRQNWLEWKSSVHCISKHLDERGFAPSEGSKIIVAGHSHTAAHNYETQYVGHIQRGLRCIHSSFGDSTYYIMSANMDLFSARAPVSSPVNSTKATTTSTSPDASGSHSFSFTTTDASYYSPPPSATRLSSVPRFTTPPHIAKDSGTPSLLNELSLASTISSPSLALTPMRYATTRNADISISNIGLGLSGLLLHDGSTFDGMGPLPKRDDPCDLGFFADETDIDGGAGTWYEQDSFAYPEQVEDAWRKRISRTVEPSALDLDVLRGLGDSPAQESMGPEIRFEGAGMHMTTESLELPAAPDDDVFYSHGPVMASTPRLSEGRTRKWRGSMSHAMVSDWRRSVHLEEQDIAGFY
ncbi:hypothetical protein BC629DRAFT_1443246 [Irpex lacteus]|nr:hypothetical protein BC629DRAFT_1443246 [Irpex lacteus]